MTNDYTNFIKWAVVSFIDRKTQDDHKDKIQVAGLPQGITITNAGKYHALYGGLNLGTYNTLEEAFTKYAEEKEKTIKDVAEEYKSRIPLKLYDAMMKYKVTYEIHNKVS